MEDTQAERLYGAQHLLFRNGQNLRTLANCRAYVNMILNDPWTRELFPVSSTTPITVRGSSDPNRAEIFTGPDARMLLPGGWARRDAVVIHELAHQFTAERFPDVEDHGPEYAGVFLWAVEQFLGRHKGMVLRAGYESEGVAWQPFIRVPLFSIPLDTSLFAA